MIEAQPSERVASPTFHITVVFSVFAFFAIIIISCIFKVEVVARGEGRVVPVGQVQILQAEFNGRIASIRVRNGSIVRKGDALIDLDSTEAASQLSIVTSEQDRLTIELARIEAMLTVVSLQGKSPRDVVNATAFFVLPDRISHNSFAEEQRKFLRSQIEDFAGSLAQSESQEKISMLSENVTRARIDRVDAAIILQEERLATSRTLFEKGAVSRSAFLDVQQPLIELERERHVLSKELEQKTAEREAIDVGRQQMIAQTQRAMVTRRVEISSRLATLSQDERVAQRRLNATRLEAPVDGIVDQLQLSTVGGVVEAGDELLRIVPTNVGLEVEGKFPNQEAGFLIAGQRANVRVDAFPSERFGFVSGTVSYVGADSVELRDGYWGYSVRITPDRFFLGSGDGRMQLRPGMTAKVDVVIEERRIIGYFFAPILEALQDSLSEP